jgi:glycosidase
MNRVMSQLAANVEKVKLGAVLLLTAPGVPFIYYGEEIGMLGKKPDEDIRTPMHWSADVNGGFTTGTPWRAVNPDSDQRNVAAESADPDSILSLYRALIGLRNGHAALRVGDLELVETGHPAVFAALRMTHDEAVLVVINLDTNEVSDYGLSLIAGALPGGVYRAVSMLDGAPGDAPQELKPLTVSAQGGFTAYQPLPALTPLQPLVLQLQPSE